ncbi:Crp/Fnr family transcriptional regulator [Rhodoferax sp. GW822-FHT02A01]|jgi:CRP-like cAMP-binding protein|uniref:Crp/Fnr family transcriptional regulator n=1 Tax=Rhodoferax sp. GW822-FHT02A01 TaxID=3141537 RepID=UPI00315CECE7
MLVNQNDFVSAYPTQLVAPGATLLRRSVAADKVIFVESGRVVLGIAAPDQICLETQTPGAKTMEHQLGTVVGPSWLEVNAAVLGLPSAVDAQAETEVVLHSVPLEDFRALITGGSPAAHAILIDVARAHRQQTELAVSRLAKDAEARCAEWLLRHAESSDKGVCSVKLQQRKRLIAAQLGIAPETLSRVLRHLRERSLISGSGRIVNLVDPGGLRSLAGV